MSPLQWALLVLGAVAVIAIYWISRRESRALKGWESKAADATVSPRLPGKDQLDMFSRPGGGEFDELGVGRPRKRTAPTLHTAQQPPLGEEPAPAVTPSPMPLPAVEDRIVTLLIAEVEGTAIFGPKIHQALAAQGLEYGEHRIYHKLSAGRTVFSVASLVKPGVLDPAQQEQFSTPGLSVFMVLPGPTQPEAALQAMVATARALASQLNAQVFDANRQPFTAEAQYALQADVQAWARRNGL